MKERFTTIKLFLIQHFFVVGLVLLFVVLSLCSCGRAAADSVGSDTASYYDYIHSITDNWVVSDRNSFNTMLDGCINSNYYFVTNGSNWIGFCPKPSFGLISEYNRGSFIPYGVGFNVSLYPVWQNSYPMYIFQVFNGGSVGVKIDDFNNGQNTLSMRYSWTGSFVKTNYNFGQAGTNQFTYNGTWYGNVDTFYEIFGSNGTGYTSGWSVYPLLVEAPRPQYVEDDRLKFSVYSLPAGGYYLQTDIRDFFPFQPGSHAVIDLVPKSITLTLDFDGTEETFVISPSNSTFSDLYIVSTPFHVLGDLADYENVSIKKCEFTIKGSAQGLDPVDETFKIACDYYLKKAVEPVEIADIEFDSDTQVDLLTQAEKDAESYIVDFSHGEGLSFSAYQSLDKPDVYEDDAYFVYMSNGGTFVQLLQLFDNWGHETDNVIGFINSIDSDVDIMEGIGDYMKENAFASYASMVVFVYIEDWTDFTAGRISSSDLTYYYYVTEVGRLRKISSQLGDLYIECNQIGHNTFAIYDFLYTRLNDFESQSLDYSFQLIGLSEKQNNILNTIDLDLQFGFDSVVDAINNIDIPQPVVFDDSDILDKIDDLISSVQDLIDGNEVDTPQECIQYFYDNQNGTVDLAFLPAYYEGMTLDFLYSIQGETQNNLRSGSKSGGGPAVLVNNSLLIQIFNQFKDSFTDNFIPQNIRVFLSNITNDTGNHMYYFQLFHNDYDPEDFDGLAD